MSTSATTLDGRIHRPGTPEFDAACAGFDLSAIPTPDLAVSARDEPDVVAAVRYAADRDVPVAVRTTGHGPISGVDGGVLVDTRALSPVAIDADRRTATIGGGSRWTGVLER